MTPLRFIETGLPRLGWYDDAYQAALRLSMRYGVSVADVADILAVTSPRVQVPVNVRLTEAYLATGQRPCLPAANVALEHWEATGEIRGPKTSAFAAAIKGDTSAVVLDTWMAKAFGHTPSFGVKARRAMTHAIRSLAGKVGVAPRDAQEALWVGVREHHGIRSDDRMTRFL